MQLFRRENYVLLVLACAEAALLLDRLAVGFLAPFLTPDLNLSNFQLGLLSSLFSLAFALSGYLISALSDRTANRWKLLAALTMSFSVISALCASSQDFLSLAAARVALGIAEGPFLPIALAIMADESSPGRRSFNLGFVQNVGAFLLAQLLGPIILVALAIDHGWRGAFVFTAVPGVVLSALLLTLARRAARSVVSVSRTEPVDSAPSTLNHPNLWICVAIAACMGSWILLQMTFMPKYLVQVAGMSPSQMSLMMSLVGIGGCAASLLLPTFSDKFGRRRTIMAGISFAVFTPLSLLFAIGQTSIMSLGIVMGSIALGCSPLYTAIIPQESVSSSSKARSMALVTASSAIVGGVLAPALGGKLADQFGLSAIFWMAGGLAALAFLVASRLRDRPVPSDTVPVEPSLSS